MHAGTGRPRIDVRSCGIARACLVSLHYPDGFPWTGAAMPSAQTPRVHPTAIISPEAELADDVQVGPYVVIEGQVRIGSGCVLRPHVHLCGRLSMGRNNV